MKLIIILLTVAALHVSAKGYSQGITLSLKDVTLKTAFYEIRKQAPTFDWFYEDNWLKDAKKVTIEVKNASLYEVLEACFKNQPFSFTINNSMITVRPKSKSALVDENVSTLLVTVKGVITNDANEPIEGVSVKLKNSDKGTYTNQKGEFLLADVDENGVLQISHISYESLEISIKNRTEFRVSLKSKIADLGDITVSSGIQTFKVNETTGAVTSVREDQLNQRVAPDVITKLEGITNGLVFNKDPLTGKNQLRVRGENTIFGYAEPLIVVDNFPYDGDINEINPNDIESVTVLKDAAAASIWGVRAGNGVIVLTTKRGKRNQPLRVEFNANATITDKPDLYYYPYIKPSDYIDYESYLFSQGRYTDQLLDPNMPGLSPVVEILNNRANGLISASDSVSQIDGLRSNDWRHEYLKNLYRKAVNQQYQINISGGAEKVSYYFSAGFDKELSSIIGNQDTRFTISNRTSYSPIKGLDILAEVNYIETNRENKGISSILNIYPYTRLKDESGNELPVPIHRAMWEDTITNHGFLDWHYYPLQDRNFTGNVEKGYATRLSTQIKYQIIGNLSADFTYQYYRSTTKVSSLTRPDSYYIRNLLNTFASLDADGNYVGSYYPSGGQLDLSNDDNIGQNGRLKIEYKNRWGDHALNLLSGADVREVKSNSSSSRLLGYDDETGTFTTPNTFFYFPTYPTGSASFGDAAALGLSYSSRINRYRSLFANSLYSFRDKYFMSASARLDQANIFGVNANEKGTPLWSVGGKWQLSKEKFYNLKLFRSLAFRFSYGYQGNLSPDAVAVVTLRYRVNPARYTGLPSAEVNNFPNPNLKWEKMRQMNFGLDFVLQNSRLSGSLDFFDKHGNDLLGISPLDITTGVSSLKGNFSDMKSTGVDFVVNSKNINSVNFKWSTNLIFNYAAEKVTRYDEISTGQQFLSAYYFTAPKVGYPLRSVFSYRWAGLDPSNGDPRIILADTVNKTYSSSNETKFEDLVYSGRYNPPIAGSLVNTFSWKNLSLSLNITYKLGHYFRRKSIDYSDFEYNWMSGHQDFSLRWQKPGDEAFTNVPSFMYPSSSQTRDDYYLMSNILVEKADHIRLQFINLDYQLDNRISRKLGLQNLNIYFYANNIGIIWRANKSGIDPDYPYLTYPPSRSYSFGVRAGL